MSEINFLIYFSARKYMYNHHQPNVSNPFFETVTELSSPVSAHNLFHFIHISLQYSKSASNHNGQTKRQKHWHCHFSPLRRSLLCVNAMRYCDTHCTGTRKYCDVGYENLHAARFNTPLLSSLWFPVGEKWAEIVTRVETTIIQEQHSGPVFISPQSKEFKLDDRTKKNYLYKLL